MKEKNKVIDLERIDKLLSNQLGYSRKEIKELIKKKHITINEQIITKPDIKVNPDTDLIKIFDKEITVKKNIYLILNKPTGYISATEDRTMKTVLDLVPQEYLHRNLFPVGRLDKDTTGLMIITDDGEFAHNILSPKKHIKKTYSVTIDTKMTNDMIEGFKKGIMLNDGKCQEAFLEITGEYSGKVILTEGRYHQIKRMFGCFGAKVLELERIKMGNLELPKDLKIGECRELTKEELNKIKKI